GGTVARIVKDEFLSGKNLKRPGIQSILDELEHGQPEWDCLCVYNLSRLTREPRDMYHVMGLLSRHSKKFLSVREPEFDFSTFQGEMMMGIITHINQYMRKQSAANVRDKMMSIAAKGLWPVGLPPYGYKRGAAKDNKLYVDPEKSSIVKDVFTMYADDRYTTRTILVKYKKQLAKSKIFTILRDPVYLGKIPYGGQIFPGQHEPIITEELFRRVQEKLPQPKFAARPKAYSYPFLLTGMIFCHCGCRLSPTTAKSGRYAYYTCTDFMCKQRVSAPKVEQAAIDRIKGNNYNPKIINAVIEEIRKRNHEAYQHSQPQLAEYQELRKKLLADKKGIVDKILFTDKLSPYLVEELNTRVNQIEQQLETLASQIAAIESLSSKFDDEYYQTGMEFIKRMKTFADLLNQPHDADRLRTIIPLYIQEIRLQENGEFKIILKEPKSSTNYPKWCTW
ncbi:MAG: recombinase family protein, partial [Lentisphaeria bacterium]|nr:recombinase family protein [Lentisphaeria bacterium]